jgi:hypothetical protein
MRLGENFPGGAVISMEPDMKAISLPVRVSFVLAVLLALAPLALALPSAPAAAQSSAFPPTRVVNVSVNFNTQLPLPDLSEEALAQTQKNGRLSLYRLARDECEVMRSVIAESCRLTNLNLSTQIQNHNNGQPLMLYVNASANFTIALKDDRRP